MSVKALGIAGEFNPFHDPYLTDPYPFFEETRENGGVSVPTEANLLLLLGSANRDPAVFEDSERFDIHRSNAKEHLSFA